MTDTLKKAPDLQAPSSLPAVEQKTPAKPAVPAPGGAKTVTLSAFEFTGNSLFGQTQLADLVKDFLNRPVSLLDIYAAADLVAQFYVDQGYTLASVNVPPQRIASGVAKLEVSEGRISRIVVEGNQRYQARHVRQYLAEVKPGQIYKSADMEAGMARLAELPGLSPRAVVRPGEIYGTTDLVITASEKPFAGLFSLDNHGRDNIGEFRTTASLTLNNPSGVEDQLTLVALRSEEGALNYQSIAYSLPLSFKGGRLAMNYGHASFTVPAAGLQPAVDGRSHNGRIGADWPLLRSRSQRADLSLGVSRTRSNSNALIGSFSQALNGTSITLFELGASYNRVHPSFAVTQVNGSLTTNFDKFTAADRLNAGGAASASADQLLRLELDIQHSRPFVNGINALLRVNGVYSPDPLSDVTQYSLGGPQSVRGFPSSEVRGDRGYLASFTLSRGFNLGPMRLAGRVFADSGKVFCVDPNTSCPTDEANSPGIETEQSLTSVGIGADAQYDRLNFKFDWATPRDQHRTSDQKDDRLFGSMYVSF